MVKTYTSAIDRLLGLPAVFTGRDLTLKFQWSAATASAYLAQWRRAAHVRALGGHSDVFMNLVVQRNPDLESVLRRAFPEAVKVGADVLREAGWTTQIMQRPEVAVRSGGPKYKVIDFTLSPRAPGWFARIKPGLEAPTQGLKRLRPAWALADMIDRCIDRRIKQAWLLAPDDLDLEAAREDAEMGIALAAFGLAPDALSDDAYTDLFERV